MNAEQYRAVIRWFNARPVAKMALRVVSRGAVALVYLGYLGMLAWLVWHRMGQFWPRSSYRRRRSWLGRWCARPLTARAPTQRWGSRRFSPRIGPGRVCPAATASRQRPSPGSVVRVSALGAGTGRAGGGHCGLPRRDRGTLCQRRAGGLGLRHSVFRTGLERLCTCGVCPGVLRHYAFVKGT